MLSSVPVLNIRGTFIAYGVGLHHCVESHLLPVSIFPPDKCVRREYPLCWCYEGVVI